MPAGAPNATTAKKYIQQPAHKRMRKKARMRTIFNRSIHKELACNEPSGHDHPGTETRPDADGACFARERREAVYHGAGGAVALVDL